jgi:hypothetical protein
MCPYDFFFVQRICRWEFGSGWQVNQHSISNTSVHLALLRFSVSFDISNIRDSAIECLLCFLNLFLLSLFSYQDYPASRQSRKPG